MGGSFCEYEYMQPSLAFILVLSAAVLTAWKFAFKLLEDFVFGRLVTHDCLDAGTRGLDWAQLDTELVMGVYTYGGLFWSANKRVAREIGRARSRGINDARRRLTHANELTVQLATHTLNNKTRFQFRGT